jgi:hypothetical protein
MGKTQELLHHRAIHIQATPFTLNALTPCDDVHIIFTMLKCSSVFVLSYGMLVGVITKDDLFAANIDADDVNLDIYASLRPKKRQFRASVKKVINMNKAKAALNESSSSERSGGGVTATSNYGS